MINLNKSIISPGLLIKSIIHITHTTKIAVATINEKNLEKFIYKSLYQFHIEEYIQA